MELEAEVKYWLRKRPITPNDTSTYKLRKTKNYLRSREEKLLFTKICRIICIMKKHSKIWFPRDDDNYLSYKIIEVINRLNDIKKYVCSDDDPITKSRITKIYLINNIPDIIDCFVIPMDIPQKTIDSIVKDQEQCLRLLRNNPLT